MGEEKIEIETGEPVLQSRADIQPDPSRNGKGLKGTGKPLSTAIIRVRSSYEQGLERARSLIEEGYKLKDLTAKQETFVQAIADGASAAEAYRFAYDQTQETPSQISSRASELQRVAHIAYRLYLLKQQKEERVLRDRDSAQAYVIAGLQRIIDTPGTHHAARVNALNLLGKYSGLFDSSEGAAKGSDKRPVAHIEAELKAKLSAYLRDSIGVIESRSDDIEEESA